jgi:uncharacterized membrane protein
MEALAMIGMILIWIGVALALFSDVDEEKARSAVVVIVTWIGLFMIIFGVMFTTYKNALDSNPYKKEYIYKQNPSGTMEKYDSIYVRIKNKEK